MLNRVFPTDLFANDRCQFIQTNGVWQPVNVPTCRFVFGILQGSGGGGGNGASGDASVSRGGGGGGGSGARIIFIVPAALLPSMLFVYTGIGGAAASSGDSSYLGLDASTSSQNVSSLYQANGGGAGGSGSTTAGTAGSLAGAINNYTFGINQSVASNAGSVGGLGAGGGSLTAAVSCASGGTGGGGHSTSADFAGGTMSFGNNGFGLFPSNVTGGAAPGGRGADGFWLPQHLFSTGGLGGGSQIGGTGGAGGNGGPGSGGGGGGSGLTGGAGGRGGDGYCALWFIS